MRSTIAAALVALAAFALPAHAQPTLRYAAVQPGDMIMIGNSLAQECNIGAPPPLTGLVTSCGGQVTDSSPDVFWRSDLSPPVPAIAEASTAITAAQARSTASLTLPAAATVTQAFLYWVARAPAPDQSVLLEREGVFSTTATAQQTYTVLPDSSLYAGVADVTATVQQNRGGAYRVADVGSSEIANVNQAVGVAAWWLVVVTSDAALQRRVMAIYDGFPFLQNGGTQLIHPLLAFTEPGTSALYIATADGDPGISGESITIDGTGISNTPNPANDLFNSTRTRFGTGATSSSDVPWQTGGAGSLGGVDLDIFDITARLTVGQATTIITLSTTNDEVWPVMVGVLTPSTFVPPPDDVFEDGFEG